MLRTASEQARDRWFSGIRFAGGIDDYEVRQVVTSMSVGMLLMATVAMLLIGILLGSLIALEMMK